MGADDSSASLTPLVLDRQHSPAIPLGSARRYSHIELATTPVGQAKRLPLEFVHFSGGSSGDVSPIGGIDAEMRDHIRILRHFFA